MFVQYRHVEFNESFYKIDNAINYIKKNHGRALIVAPGRIQYRNFKKDDIVIINQKKTIENSWMEVKLVRR